MLSRKEKDELKEAMLQHIIVEHDFDLDTVNKVFECFTCNFKYVGKKEEDKK